MNNHQSCSSLVRSVEAQSDEDEGRRHFFRRGEGNNVGCKTKDYDGVSRGWFTYIRLKGFPVGGWWWQRRWGDEGGGGSTDDSGVGDALLQRKRN